MRISEDRYSRDLRSIQLARRLIHHEVRTQSICAWTGLSDERIRNLCRSYRNGSVSPQRHRGPAPSRLTTFLRSPALRCEASAIAGLASVLGIIPRRPLPNARNALPGVELGERLCHAFELFQRMVPDGQLTMDQVILLTLTLAQGEELDVVRCPGCHAALLIDPLSVGSRQCHVCKNGVTRSFPGLPPGIC